MSTRIIVDDGARALKWAQALYPEDLFGWDNFTCLLLEKELEPQAAVFYTNWYPSLDSIDINIAAAVGENWLTRPFLRAAFRYPFLELGVRRIGALVRANNHRSLTFTRHIGFVQEGVHREAWAPGVDVISFGMLKAECRYLTGPIPETWSVHGLGQPIYRQPGVHTGQVPAQVLRGTQQWLPSVGGRSI